MADTRSWDLDGKRNRLYGRKWRACREAFLSAEPLCAMCGELGQVAAATVVDHIVPHRGDEALFWDRGNWQPLCQHHHNSEKARLEIRGYSMRLGDDGWPVDPEHPANTGVNSVSAKSMPDELRRISVEVVLVCGAPGSGKTTWCKSQMGARDILIDFDEIDGTINRRARRAGRLVVPILRERNRLLLDAANRSEGRVFLTLLAARKQERDWWKNKLGRVTSILMDTPLHVCLSRMRADGERAERIEALEASAREWSQQVSREGFDLIVDWTDGGADNHQNGCARTPAPSNKIYLVSALTNAPDDDAGFA